MATPPDFTAGQVLTAAQMNQIGLWYITKKDISGGSTAIDNCFTADYRNYRVIWRIATSTGDPEIRMNFRAGGSTNATNNYRTGVWLVDTAGTANLSINTTYSYWGIAYAAAGNTCSGSMDIIGPQIAANTSFHGNSTNSTGITGRSVAIGGVHAVASAMDGIILTASTGTFTGEIVVYGYNQ